MSLYIIYQKKLFCQSLKALFDTAQESWNGFRLFKWKYDLSTWPTYFTSHFPLEPANVYDQVSWWSWKVLKPAKACRLFYVWIPQGKEKKGMSQKIPSAIFSPQGSSSAWPPVKLPILYFVVTLWLFISVELWDVGMLGDQAACAGMIVGRNWDIWAEVIVHLYCWQLCVITTSAVAKFHEFQVSQLIWLLV